MKWLLTWAVALQLASGACIPEVVTDLVKAPTAATKRANAALCKNVAATEGMCMDYNQLDNQILILKSNNRQATNTVFTAIHGQMVNSSAKILKVCDKVAGKAVGDKLGNVTITQQIIDSCLQLTASRAVLSARTEFLLNNTYQNNCNAAIYRMMNGSLCLMLSAAASTYGSYSNGAMTLYVKQAAVDYVFSRCAPVFLSACYINQAAFVSKNFSARTFNSGLYDVCRANVASLEGCYADATKCGSDVKNAVVTFLMTPRGAAFNSAIGTDLESDTNAIPDSTTQRRLAAAVTYSFAVDEDKGYDVTQNNTGLPDSVTAGSSGSDGSTTSTTAAPVLLTALAALLALLS